MYASSDVNIVYDDVLWAIFTQKNTWVPLYVSEYNLRSAIWVLIAQWSERLTGDQKVAGPRKK